MKLQTFLVLAVLAVPVAARSQDSAGSTPPALDLSTPAPSASPSPVAVTASAPAPVAAAAEKHGIFPLWGDKVRAKGFDLPEPFGFMVNYYFQQSDIQITDLQLGLNDGPMRDAGFITIPDARTKASALAIRPNVMILPFLSVYAVFSSGATETNVHITEPVEMSTLAKSGAQVLSLGATFQLGYKGFFGVADFNGSVSDVERLADAVGANMLSFRLGYNHKLNQQGRGLAMWVGTAGQVIDVATEGTVKLADVLKPPNQPTIDAARERCSGFRGPREEACSSFVDGLEGWANGTSAPDTAVHYSLDKKPKHVWNMVLGAQLALDRNWQFRVESTFLNGRTSILVGPEYRFDYM